MKLVKENDFFKELKKEFSEMGWVSKESVVNAFHRAQKEYNVIETKSEKGE